MTRLYWLWLFAVTLIAFAVSGIQSTLEERRLLNDSVTRASALATSIEDSVSTNFNAKRFDRIARTVDRLRSGQRLLGMALCLPDRTHSRAFPSGSGWESLCRLSKLTGPAALQTDLHWVENTRGGKVLYYAHALDSTSIVTVLAQDISFIRARWIESFLRTLLVTWVAGIALLLLVATQTRNWAKLNLMLLQTILRYLIAGKRPPSNLQTSAHHPIQKEIEKLTAKILSLSSAQARKTTESSWLAELRSSMGQKKLVVIANREPYIHQRMKDRIEVIRPASGLVTALEPILRHCGGLWLAHGGGSADQETANAQGEVAVPPGSARYTLKRIWLSRDEEMGYYYGFSNEGLWPLCHLAHNRPTFRLTDWEFYSTVNRKFCESIPESVLNDDNVILVQDYHFALLPRMIQARAQGKCPPKIGLFWHIPWPNPEAFGICPWNKELLIGMLGADVVGFHTQYHCNNFLESCDRYLEARIDWENFSVTMGNQETLIRAFPIGIDTSPVRYLSDEERTALRARYGIHAEQVAVGVDRLDYTKGLVERVDAVERFLEKYPENIGKFTFVQMGSPSRTHISAYRALAEQLEKAVERVNARFSKPDHPYRPVLLLSQHHEWDEIQYFYQLGDLCMVTSLHDGMNLVAKEYVWCQRPDRGSLMLSKFTGASRELTEAFIVNPYSTEEMADAIASALRLSPAEREQRMKAMRDKVQGHNAFHWASDLIQALIKKPRDVMIGSDESRPSRSDRSGRLRLAKAIGEKTG